MVEPTVDKPAPICKSGIYAIRNTISGRVYVGSSQNIKGRWANHRSDLEKGRHHSLSLQRSWIKHGREAFSFEVLEAVEDMDSLHAREQVWIVQLNAAHNKLGYNNNPTAGSGRGYKWSDEAKQRIRLARTGKKKKPLSGESLASFRAFWAAKVISAETRAKMSASSTGKKRPPRTKEHQERLSASRRGKKMSPEACARMSAAHRGVPLAPEHAEKSRKHIVAFNKTPAARECKRKLLVAKNKARGRITDSRQCFLDL